MPMPRFELETLASLMTGVIGYPHKYNALPLSYTGLSDWNRFEVYQYLIDLVIGSRHCNKVHYSPNFIQECQGLILMYVAGCRDNYS